VKWTDSVPEITQIHPSWQQVTKVFTNFPVDIDSVRITHGGSDNQSVELPSLSSFLTSSTDSGQDTMDHELLLRESG